MENTYAEMENESNIREVMLYKDVDKRALEWFRTPSYYKVIMAKENARKYFSVTGLSYDKISLGDLHMLLSILKEELENFKKSNKGSTQYNMQIIEPTWEDIEFRNGKLIWAYLRVRSSNFTNRECISFNRNGFIGFAGWVSGNDITQILNGFIKWCDLINK